MSGRTGGSSAAAVERRLRTIETLTVRCELCPTWERTGTAYDMLKAQDAHILEHGLERKKRRPGAVNGIVRAGRKRA